MSVLNFSGVILSCVKHSAVCPSVDRLVCIFNKMRRISLYVCQNKGQSLIWEL